MVARAGDYHGQPWHLAISLAELELEANEYAPQRGHATDGSIGDPAHQSQGAPTYNLLGKATGGTDHEPDDVGVVCALDLGHDPAHGFDANTVAHTIAGHVTAGSESRVDYLALENVVPGRKLLFHDPTGTGRPHWDDVGPSTAAPHLHTSVLHTPNGRNSGATWDLANVQRNPPHPPPPHLTAQEADVIPFDDGKPHDVAHLPYVTIGDDGHTLYSFFGECFPHGASNVRAAYGGQVVTLTKPVRGIAVKRDHTGKGTILIRYADNSTVLTDLAPGVTV